MKRHCLEYAIRVDRYRSAEAYRNIREQQANRKGHSVYGSRAKGNFKPFSDVDITLVGEELSRGDLNQVIREVDDLLLPYQFDISLCHKLKNEALIEHIDRRGIEIYARDLLSSDQD